MASVGMARRTKALLRLIDDVGGVDAVISKVVVVEPAAGEADAALVASAGVDRAGSQRRQGRPVSAVQRQLLHLFGLSARAQRVGGLVELRSCRRRSPAA